MNAPTHIEIDEHGRPEPPVNADEAGTLFGFLEFHRATLAWKCRGVDAAGMRTTVGPSSMTLGGLLKHLAWVEDFWFSVRLHGREEAAPWKGVDWKTDPDWEWNSAVEDSPERLLGLWQDAVTASRTATAEALESGGLDTEASPAGVDGRVLSLRWILVHMIEEYSRHNGHADLLREAIDGRTGE